jgi:hypothetical protein
MQDTGKTRARCPDAPLVGGEPCERRGRRRQPGVGREALRRAAEGSQRLRDGAGEEAVRPGQLYVQRVLEPWLGWMRLPLRTVPVATGMMDAGVSPTTLARREAVAVGSTVALVESAADLAV